MGLEVKFFVHGVSKGHKTWGAEDTDIKYANAFYSVNWPLKEMMMVEVRGCIKILMHPLFVPCCKT